MYVGEGTLDVGISGRDLVLDSHADADIIMELGFGGSTFRFAGRPGVAYSVKDLPGKRIATSFAGILTDHLAENGVDASVVKLDGAVESAVQLGVADVIADVVETGTTLRQAGLEVFGEPILQVRGGADQAPRRRASRPVCSSSSAGSRASWSRATT